MKATQIVDKLIELGYKISFAESCTGGLLAATFVEVPNASKVFNESFVTYSDESKIIRLGVDKNIIDEHSVYSKEVSDQMAEKVAVLTNSNVGVGISGIAGPTGGSETNPVGTVYMSIYINGKIYSYKEWFKDKERNQVRNLVIDYIINKLNNLL